jgi:hypothetical protein
MRGRAPVSVPPTRAGAVYVPYVLGWLQAETRKSVPATARFVDVSSDDQAYWRLLRDLWHAGDDFIVVEQDIVVWPGLLNEMSECTQDWCSSPYRMSDIETTALGCVKFGSPLLTRTAGLLDGILEQHRSWQGLDGMLTGELHRRGYQEHVHLPAVRHLHKPTTQPPRRRILTKLRYVGDGAHFFNGVPASDFQTDDPVLVAQCVESGLYVDVTTRRTKEVRPDFVQKFMPITVDKAEAMAPEPPATTESTPPLSHKEP